MDVIWLADGVPEEEVAPGIFLALPGCVRFTGIDLGGSRYDVELTLEQISGRIQATAVTVRQPEHGGSPPVTSATMRKVRVHDLTRQAILAGVQPGPGRGQDSGDSPGLLLDPGLTEQELELTRLRGPVPSSLERAAWFYNVGQLVGLPPARQVEIGLGMPRTTATKWIRRARDLGLINPGAAGDDAFGDPPAATSRPARSARSRKT